MNLFANEQVKEKLEELRTILPSGTGIVLYCPGPNRSAISYGLDFFSMFALAGWLEVQARISVIDMGTEVSSEEQP